MAQNRKISYGYQIVGGVVTVNKDEESIVQGIYQMYADGLSYLSIATELTNQGIRYMPSKPEWNKNMIARMLQNKNYLGNEKYPCIIPEILYQQAQASMKTYTPTESSDIKKLKNKLVCDICGQHLKRRIKASGSERWYCPSSPSHISLKVTDGSIIKDISNLQKQFSYGQLNQVNCSSVLSIETIQLQNEIDALLTQTELQVEKIKETIMKLAALQYDLCANEYAMEDAKIQALGRRQKRIDAELLDQLIADIRINKNQITKAVMKSGRIFMKGENHG
ncbi:recombinase family protein [Chakrabartyella piscis]|uniref:recombinase family protein n=1 Tax=Chakrabartyella piscis TaxID=2918914 RepID=UPI002958C119|nr:recombinase family protein [Chakrabartyella piscis]